MNYELLWHAFRKLKRDRAPGADGVTVEQYETNLRENLRDLETRLHRQSYRPHPSLRRDIPKGNGKTRPLGIACVEDKIVQRAVVMILERIYEVDFSDASCGFRPGRSCHRALSVLGQIIATKKVSWISDADIFGFFDNVCHCTFELESDALRFQDVLPNRLARFSLELAEEKTKLLRFGRFAERETTRRGEGGSEHVRLPRFHALLRPQPRRQIQAEKENGDEEAAGEVPGVERLVGSWI